MRHRGGRCAIASQHCPLPAARQHRASQATITCVAARPQRSGPAARSGLQQSALPQLQTPCGTPMGLAASARGGTAAHRSLSRCSGPGKLAGTVRGRRKSVMANARCFERFACPSTAQRPASQPVAWRRLLLSTRSQQLPSTYIPPACSTPDCRPVMLHAAAASFCQQSCSASRRRHSCSASQPSALAPKQWRTCIGRRMICRRVQQGGADCVTEHALCQARHCVLLD